MIKLFYRVLFFVFIFNTTLFAQDLSKMEKIYLSAVKYINGAEDLDALNKIMEEAKLIDPDNFASIDDWDSFEQGDPTVKSEEPNAMTKEFTKFVYFMLQNNDDNVVYILDNKSLVNSKHYFQIIDLIKEETGVYEDKEIFKLILEKYNELKRTSKQGDLVEIWFKLLEHHYFKNIRKIDPGDPLIRPNGSDCINFGYEEAILSSLYIHELDLSPYALAYVLGPKDIDKVIELLNSRIYDQMWEMRDVFNRLKEEQIKFLKQTQTPKANKLLSYYKDYKVTRYQEKYIDNEFKVVETTFDLGEKKVLDLRLSYTEPSSYLTEQLDHLMSKWVEQNGVLTYSDKVLLFGVEGEKGVYDLVYNLVLSGTGNEVEELKSFLILSGAIAWYSQQVSFSDFGALGREPTCLISTCYISLGVSSGSVVSFKPYIKGNTAFVESFKSGKKAITSYNKTLPKR